LHKNVGIESRVSGFLFLAIAIAVLTGTVISEILSTYKIPIYYQLLSWLLIFALILGITFMKMKNMFQTIRNRMKNSLKWPVG